MNRSNPEPRVVIVGAGPVGLTLAIDLGRRGVPVLIVESKDAPANLPKMERSNARTMEIFRRLGIADRVRASVSRRRADGRLRHNATNRRADTPPVLPSPTRRPNLPEDARRYVAAGVPAARLAVHARAPPQGSRRGTNPRDRPVQLRTRDLRTGRAWRHRSTDQQRRTTKRYARTTSSAATAAPVPCGRLSASSSSGRAISRRCARSSFGPTT